MTKSDGYRGLRLSKSPALVIKRKSRSLTSAVGFHSDIIFKTGIRGTVLF